MHGITYLIYDSKESWSSISSKARKECANRSEYGHDSGSITKYSHIAKNKEEAIEYLKSKDTGWYDCIACQFYEFPNLSSKVVESLDNKIKELNNKYFELNNTIHYANVKASFVSCPSCNSKINKDFIKWNNCPICRIDMRPKTILDRLAQYKEKIKSLEIEKNNEIKHLQEKNIRKAKVKWLVKIEYHC